MRLGNRNGAEGLADPSSSVRKESLYGFELDDVDRGRGRGSVSVSDAGAGSLPWYGLRACTYDTEEDGRDVEQSMLGSAVRPRPQSYIQGEGEGDYLGDDGAWAAAGLPMGRSLVGEDEDEDSVASVGRKEEGGVLAVGGEDDGDAGLFRRPPTSASWMSRRKQKMGRSERGQVSTELRMPLTDGMLQGGLLIPSAPLYVISPTDPFTS